MMHVEDDICTAKAIEYLQQVRITLLNEPYVYERFTRTCYELLQTAEKSYRVLDEVQDVFHVHPQLFEGFKNLLCISRSSLERSQYQRGDGRGLQSKLTGSLLLMAPTARKETTSSTSLESLQQQQRHLEVRLERQKQHVVRRHVVALPIMHRPVAMLAAPRLYLSRYSTVINHPGQFEADLNLPLRTYADEDGPAAKHILAPDWCRRSGSEGDIDSCRYRQCVNVDVVWSTVRRTRLALRLMEKRRRKFVIGDNRTLTASYLKLLTLQRQRWMGHEVQHEIAKDLKHMARLRHSIFPGGDTRSGRMLGDNNKEAEACRLIPANYVVRRAVGKWGMIACSNDTNCIPSSGGKIYSEDCFNRCLVESEGNSWMNDEGSKPEAGNGVAERVHGVVLKTVSGLNVNCGNHTIGALAKVRTDAANDEFGGSDGCGVQFCGQNRGDNIKEPQSGLECSVMGLPQMSRSVAILRSTVSQHTFTRNVLAYAAPLSLFLPLPRSTIWTGVNNNYRVEDETVLKYVPYFGDDDTTGVDVSAFDRVPGEKNLDAALDQELNEEFLEAILTQHGQAPEILDIVAHSISKCARTENGGGRISVGGLITLEALREKWVARQELLKRAHACQLQEKALSTVLRSLSGSAALADELTGPNCFPLGHPALKVAAMSICDTLGAVKGGGHVWPLQRGGELEELGNRLRGVFASGGVCLSSYLQLGPTAGGLRLGKLHEASLQHGSNKPDVDDFFHEGRVLPSTLVSAGGGKNAETYGMGFGSDVSYDTAVESYRELLCRRCFIYDCRLHGVQQPQPRIRKDPDTLPSFRGPASEVRVDKTVPTYSLPCGTSCYLLGLESGNEVSVVIDENIVHTGAGEVTPDDGRVRDSREGERGGSKRIGRAGRGGGVQSVWVCSAGATSGCRNFGSYGEKSGTVELSKEARDMHDRSECNAVTATQPSSGQMCCTDGGAPSTSSSRPAWDGANWSVLDYVLLAKMRSVEGMNCCEVARLLRTQSCSQVWHNFLASDNENIGDTGDIGRKRKKSQRHSNRERGNHGLYKKGLQRTQARELVPCNHHGPCSTANCPCAQNAAFCEKFCACDRECRNRFPGCRCRRSGCHGASCICFASCRECDPDLCKGCGARTLGSPGVQFDLDAAECGGDVLSSMPPEQDQGGGTRVCRNVCVLTRRHKRLMIGRSSIHGWGAFIMEAAEKSEFLYEYVGEIVSQNEADRRGKIYDKLKCSFLFNLNEECVVDATRRGNKIKFANHNRQPNCFAKVILVNGDHKIGIYAKRDICAGEELSFDYAYGEDNAPTWTSSKKARFL